MKKTWIRIVSVGIVGILCFVFMPRSVHAFQAEVEATDGWYQSVVIGESVTLKQYAENTQTENYVITSGFYCVRDNGNGIFTFTAYGSVQIQGTVYNIKGEVVAVHYWNFNVYYSNPVVVTQPQSVTVYSGEKAVFSVETKQEEEFLNYRWICSDATGKAVSSYAFPNATGWTSKTLIINDCKSWMNGYKFYCIISLKSNTRAQTLTTTEVWSYPVLSVLSHPVDSVLTLQGLDTLQKGVLADYQAEITSKSCQVSSISYWINGNIQNEYIPSIGDEVTIKIVLVPSEGYSFSGSDYVLLWEGFQNDYVSGNQSEKTFSFSYRLTNDGDISEMEESGEDGGNEGGGNQGENAFHHFSNPLFRIVFGSFLMLSVIALFILILAKTRKSTQE